ncbi:hypothetical protein GPECTOR_2g1514 [Gonium pectorale]|uniref:Uncharacterized protein n=1 Tax=Gonium pectorale TaxID=33097 RepID=A0A150H1R4_GONPE|nr:hypothetical protein GPECTOR_2g1514 [Gonium pectorale]|eukprot:KXZ55963.1 hypothetical protein GPECTOR_2g1514 [Gonium pectorale]
MAASPALSPEQELHLQTAFLLSSAVDAPDPVARLKEQAIQPTVFIAFSNSLRHSAHDVPGQTSMANFMASQRQCGFPGAAALEGLPLNTVFSLLGQGYKLVATGYKFGGVVAHLFTVSSYAFGSPFFATSSMGRVLASLDLQQPQAQPGLPQRSLHTVWRAGDGSPAFFAAASELFTVASAARDAAADAAAADVGGGAEISEDSLSPASILRAPQVTSVQEWCRFVADGVDALSRCQSTSPSRLLARPLDYGLLNRVCMPGGLFVPPTVSRAPSRGESESGSIVDRVQQVRIADGEAGVSANGGSKLMARARGLISARVSRARSIDNGLDGMAVPPTPRAPSPSARSTSRSRRHTAASADLKVASRAGSMTAVPPRQGSISSFVSPLAVGGGLRQGSITAGKMPPVRQGAWKDGLLRLLQVMSDGLGERYAPVGQFWIVGSLSADNSKAPKPVIGDRVATAAAASAAAAAAAAALPPSLQPAEGARAMQSSASWLSPGNGACLFARWEAELEELQKDLMDAFPWVRFSPKLEVRGGEMDRRELLRVSASLNLTSG